MILFISFSWSWFLSPILNAWLAGSPDDSIMLSPSIDLLCNASLPKDVPIFVCVARPETCRLRLSGEISYISCGFCKSVSSIDLFLFSILTLSSFFKDLRVVTFIRSLGEDCWAYINFNFLCQLRAHLLFITTYHCFLRSLILFKIWFIIGSPIFSIL